METSPPADGSSRLCPVLGRGERCTLMTASRLIGHLVIIIIKSTAGDYGNDSDFATLLLEATGTNCHK